MSADELIRQSYVMRNSLLSRSWPWWTYRALKLYSESTIRPKGAFPCGAYKGIAVSPHLVLGIPRYPGLRSPWGVPISHPQTHTLARQWDHNYWLFRSIARKFRGEAHLVHGTSAQRVGYGSYPWLIRSLRGLVIGLRFTLRLWSNIIMSSTSHQWS